MKTNQAPLEVQQRMAARRKQNRATIIRNKTKAMVISILRGLLLFGLCFMIIQPLITRFASSLMAEKDLYDSTVILVPRNPTLENYVHAFNLTHFPISMLNTLWISLLVSLLQVISTTLVAYGFARYNFPLKKFWFGCVVALIIIPPQTISTSLYMYFTNFDILGIFKATLGHSLNLRASLWPYALMCLTCMGLKDGLYIYMLRQYFRGIPKSLEEAAYIDGCNTLHTFVRIMLPDAKPIIFSCFLFSFVWQWTDLFYARNFLTGGGRRLYATEMSTMVSNMSRYFAVDGKAVTVSAARQQQMISIAVLICCIPLVILYCFTQKTFVQSIAMSGGKE